MVSHPHIQPLSRNKRRFYFFGLLTVFVLGVPALILFATGYRLGNGTELIATGGMYVGTDGAGAEIFINNELVQETRIFRRGFYAQNLEPGVHRVHVQKEDHHTWVKEIVVVPHRVSEAQAFNVPLIPETREIPRFTMLDGTPLFELATATASTTAAILASTTASTTPNNEYEDILELFALTTATGTTETLDLLRIVDGELIATTTTAVPTTTKERQDMQLFEREGALLARWIGDDDDIPYYFCAVATSSAAVLAPSADTLTPDVFVPVPRGTTTDIAFTDIILNESCRDEIEIVKKDGDTIAFDFFPESSDLVILLLADGIYVQEIDDRGWQNMQPLYLKEDIDMRIVDGRIYVLDDIYLLEIRTDV